MSDMDDEERSPKLNILALPSHTSLLFALIALVVLGAALTSVLPGSQLCWPPIVLGLTVLPLRDFLRRPDRVLARWKLARQRNESSATIEQEVASLAPDRTPTVVTTDRPLGAQAFGSFRRSFLGLDRTLAGRLCAELRSHGENRLAARAILAHELAHFLNRDVWYVWLSYGLLKMMMLVALLGMWVGVSFTKVLIENGPEVMRPEFWTALSQLAFQGLPGPSLNPIYDTALRQNPTLVQRLADPSQRIENWRPFLLNLTGSYWPFIASGLALFVFYWRRLLRVREFYADARAAALVGSAAAVQQAQTLYALLSSLTTEVPTLPRRAIAWMHRALASLPFLNRQLATHPTFRERAACLQDPVLALGSWRSIAISVGLAVILLDFLLRGALTAAYVYEPGPHLPFLAAFLVFAVWLLPQVCLGIPIWRDLVKQVSLLVLLFTIIKLLPHILDGSFALVMLATNPERLGAMLDLWVYSLFGGYTTGLPRIVGYDISLAQIIDWHFVRPVAYFGLLMPPTLIVLLLADAALKRRALTWYELEGRMRRVFTVITVTLACILALVALPVFNRILFPHIYQGRPPATILSLMLGLLLIPVGTLAFWLCDRKLAGRCPACGASVCGAYKPGKKCAACGQPLHSWLVANY